MEKVKTLGDFLRVYGLPGAVATVAIVAVAGWIQRRLKAKKDFLVGGTEDEEDIEEYGH